MNYEDIFDCLAGKRSAVTVFSWLLEVREELLEAVGYHWTHLLRGTAVDFVTSPLICEIYHQLRLGQFCTIIQSVIISLKSQNRPKPRPPCKTLSELG